MNATDGEGGSHVVDHRPGGKKRKRGGKKIKGEGRKRMRAHVPIHFRVNGKRCNEIYSYLSGKKKGRGITRKGVKKTCHTCRRSLLFGVVRKSGRERAPCSTRREEEGKMRKGKG